MRGSREFTKLPKRALGKSPHHRRNVLTTHSSIHPTPSQSSAEAVVITLPASINAPLSPTDTLAHVKALSRRGKLPNFTPHADGSFTVTAFGQPFDHTLRGRISPAEGGSSITFTLSMARKTPIIMAAIVLFTVWPGVWLTDSMLKTYFTSYEFVTWMWYIPLTVLPLPFMWRKWHRQSVHQATEHAAESIQQITSALAAPSQHAH